VNEIDRRNLYRFCHAIGVDFDLADETTTGDAINSYRLKAGGRDWTGEMPAVKIRRFGRFGNNIRQIINAAHVTEAIGAERLYIEEVNVGALVSEWRQGGICFRPFPPPADELVLTGPFFYRDCFRRFFAGFDGADQLRVVSDIIAPMLRCRWGEVKGSAEDVLHIHIRSGDNFRAGGVHRSYVQPPLAYYRTVIDHFAQTKCTPKIVLVFEDRSNPCVDALCAALGNRSIAYSMLCSGFENAVDALLSARTLVIGFGTFAPMIGLTSTHLRRLYAFRAVPNRLTFAAKRTEIFVGRDAGDYIAPNTWRNSPDQLRCMIDYPDHDVQIV
jgi:hypothetical protein